MKNSIFTAKEKAKSFKLVWEHKPKDYRSKGRFNLETSSIMYLDRTSGATVCGLIKNLSDDQIIYELGKNRMKEYFPNVKI